MTDLYDRCMRNKLHVCLFVHFHHILILTSCVLCNVCRLDDGCHRCCDSCHSSETSQIALPKMWAKMDEGQMFIKVDISSGCQEYKKVAENFKQNIVKVLLCYVLACNGPYDNSYALKHVCFSFFL